MTWHTVSVVAGLLTTLIGPSVDAQHTQIAGVTCASPPPLHCPEANCPRELIAHPGNAILPQSNRAFFLDYPCDLKPADTVTFVLNLHGGGSIGNWERHYFPIMVKRFAVGLIALWMIAPVRASGPSDVDMTSMSIPDVY